MALDTVIEEGVFCGPRLIVTNDPDDGPAAAGRRASGDDAAPRLPDRGQRDAAARVEIGEEAVVGAGSLVTRSVPPRTVVVGRAPRGCCARSDDDELARMIESPPRSRGAGGRRPGGGARVDDHRPRPAAADNARVAREIEAAVRDARRGAGHDRAARRRRCGSGSTTRALDAIATRDDVAKCSARDLPLAARARRERRDDRRRHRAPRRARRHPRVRHRRARRRAPRGAARRGTSRPTSSRSRARDLRRVRGREVDPRRRRATLERLETLGVGVARLPAPTASPASTSPTPATRCRGGSTRRTRSPRCCGRATSSASRARSSSPTRSTSSSTRSCTSACWREALAAAGAQGMRGRDVTPFLLARFHARDRRREPARQRAARAAQRRAGRRDRGGGGR